MSKIVGIDLGTTNSSVAIPDGSQPQIIPNPLGNRFTPSVVRFLENGEVIVGENALRARMVDPKHTLTGIKRFMGRRYNEVFDIAQRMPFEVTLGINNLAVFNVRGKNYAPQSVSAMILKALKKSAEDYLGDSVEGAVITVPAYFGDAQRQATREAGEIAGFYVHRIINEPTAAALAYRSLIQEDSKVVVFDLGGGTFDVTIMRIALIDDEHLFEALSVSGDGFLGGDDFDGRVVAWLIEEIRQEYGIDLTNNMRALQRLLEAATQAKHELSERLQANIRLPFLVNDNGQPIHVDMVLTRGKFEELCEELFERLREPCKTVLKVAGLGSDDIDEVLLVGGATRIAKVREIAEALFGRCPRTLVNPQDAVAIGAAVQAGVLSGKEKKTLLLDVLPHTLGVEIEDGSTCFLIEANTMIPRKATKIFSTSRDNQTTVEVHVIEGDKPRVVDNRILGRLMLEGIAPAPKGVPQIEVTMDIDANKVVLVSVKDIATGKENTLTVRAWTGLERQDIVQLSAEVPAIRAI